MTCCGKRLTGKEDRYTFRPDFHNKQLTEKFYARHERLELPDPIPPNVAFYVQEIDRRLYYDPRDHTYAPRTENQVYGWIENKAIRYPEIADRNLMFYPKKTDEIMSTMRQVACELARDRRIFGIKN